LIERNDKFADMSIRIFGERKNKGWRVTLKYLAQRMRCSKCGRKGAEVVAVARPRPRGVPKTPTE